MVSTSGSALLEEPALELLKTKLLPLADIITPNIPEAEVLSGMRIHDRRDMQRAAAVIAQDYDGYILMKGGHSMNRADDLLVYKEDVHLSLIHILLLLPRMAIIHFQSIRIAAYTYLQEKG